MMKRILILVVLVISAVLCLLLSACTPADEYPFSPIALEKRFGDSMEEVVEDLSIDLSAVKVEELNEEQTDIRLKNVSIGENVTAVRITIRFYNNVFYSLFCSSEDRGFIYDQTIAVYERCNDKYGEKMTDENLTERNIARVNFKAKPGKEEFVNSIEDAYVASWWAENKRVSEAVFNGEPLRFNLVANSVTNGDEKWATLGISFNSLYFYPERLNTGGE